MVAEMMILAGEAVGTVGAQQHLPLPYRGQEVPQLPPQEVLDALPEGPCRGYALRRCMTRSVIEPAPVRHASLALDAYVQFTSPIRRYSDIMTHFNLKVRGRGSRAGVAMWLLHCCMVLVAGFGCCDGCTVLMSCTNSMLFL
eukprot:GHUV01021581.1.p5 GENE.GHUV01021581.1~~GHUV01021581.1.p5  ORF type:complete len:142 (-),score=36.61 GHUV01021581.1:511-936(-)